VSNEYWKLLQRPEWQRKRLEVFERAGFKCEECGSTTEQLHAHHKIYHKGHAPWEYELSELSCLCDGCHERWHNLKNFLLKCIVDLDMHQISKLCGFAAGLTMTAGVRYIGVQSREAVEGVALALGVSPEAVEEARDQFGVIEYKDLAKE
jgi:hypothetical protein